MPHPAASVALAEETAGAPQEPTTEDAPPAVETVTSETITVDTSDADLPDNDELFAAYVQQLMYPSYGVTPLADWGMTSGVLNRDEQSVYEILKSYIGQIADGNRTETNNLTLYKNSPSWTYEELEAAGPDDPNLQARVQEAFSKVFDISKVVNCLLVDCPESFSTGMIKPTMMGRRLQRAIRIPMPAMTTESLSHR